MLFVPPLLFVLIPLYLPIGTPYCNDFNLLIYCKVLLYILTVCLSLSQVHRKTLNPVFNETFQFGVPLNELHSRKLHFSVYDFDRFSRHDLIGQVVVDNLLDFSEGSGDKPVWRDIVEGTAVRIKLCCRNNTKQSHSFGRDARGKLD